MWARTAFAGGGVASLRSSPRLGRDGGPIATYASIVPLSPLRPLRVLRQVVGAAALAGAAVGLVGLVLFALDSKSDTLVALASFVPFMLVAAVAATIAAAAIGHRVIGAASLCVVLVGAAMLAPMYIGAGGAADAEEGGIAVRVMTANLWLGQAEPEPLVHTVRDRGVQVLTVQELTPESVAGLRDAGLEALLPHRLLAPSPGGGGAGIYSQFPLANGRTLPGYLPTNLAADVDVGTKVPLALFAVHPMPPVPSAAVWSSELQQLRADLASVAGREHVVASGDFNSTFAHKPFRDLLALGYTDASEHLGGGLMPTYPAHRRFPALVGIDHILTKGATATAVERVAITGSDHHGLIADIRIAR